MDHLNFSVRARALISAETPEAGALQRLLGKVTAGPNGCIIWTGDTARGYGVAWKGGRRNRAHRVSFELLVGSIPSGMQIDHLCHTLDETCPGGATCLHRRCINPHHLEPVTLGENVLRGRGITAQNKAKKSCLRGHPLEGDNVYIPPGTGQRHCRTCKRDAAAAALPAMRSANAERTRKRRLEARLGKPECGHISQLGNACTRPLGHDGQHNAKAVPLNEALLRVRQGGDAR